MERRAEREALDLAAIVASSDDAIVGKTLDGTVTSWNAAAERLYGASVIARDIKRRIQADERQVRDALLLANVRDAVVVTDTAGSRRTGTAGRSGCSGGRPPISSGGRWRTGSRRGGRAAVLTEIERLAAGGEGSGEFEDWRRDGSRVWIDARASPITDLAGNVIGVLGLSHDITERERAEVEVRRSERLLRQVLDALPTGVVVTDRAGDVLMMCGYAVLEAGNGREAVRAADRHAGHSICW